MSMKTVLCVGGRGALGSKMVKTFGVRGWNTISVDVDAVAKSCGENGSYEVLLAGSSSASERSGELNKALKGFGVDSLDCVVNAAGGWAPGTINSDEIFDNSELMWKMNVESALLAGHIASKYLCPGNGSLILTGAEVSRHACPEMLSYSMSKAAIHYMIKSFNSEQGRKQFPQGTKAAAILPITIDTPSNRANMPDMDHSSWTSPEEIAEHVFHWANDTSTLSSGGLYTFTTSNGKTTVECNFDN